MAANNRICFVCQEKYRYCPSCEGDYLKPTWMVMFHDENCKVIFETLQKHFLKELTDEEALSIIEKCDLSHMNEFREDSKIALQRLLAKKKKVTKVRRKVNKPSE